MAGNVNQQTAPRSRYLPKGYALSWWMLAVTTGAIFLALSLWREEQRVERDR